METFAVIVVNAIIYNGYDAKGTAGDIHIFSSLIFMTSFVIILYLKLVIWLLLICMVSFINLLYDKWLFSDV